MGEKGNPSTMGMQSLDLGRSAEERYAFEHTCLPDFAGIMVFVGHQLGFWNWEMGLVAFGEFLAFASAATRRS